MFIMHILQLHSDRDLVYFMTSAFVTKNKFLLPLLFFLVYVSFGSFTSLHVF